VAASQISRSISSSEKNHGLRFEGILKIQFARKSPSKGQKPANSITSAHPISQPAQGISEFFTDDEFQARDDEWIVRWRAGSTGSRSIARVDGLVSPGAAISD
jgi:hypothetical protein